MRGASSNSDGHRSKPTLVLVMMLIAVLTSGCLQATVSLSMSGDDRVSGDVLLAVPVAEGKDPIRLSPPEGFGDRVSITPYSSNGVRGSKLSFENLTFTEVERLGRSLSTSQSRYRFSIDRAGSLVNVQGRVDLTPLEDTNSSVLIEISTPGEVTTTNGEVNGGVLSWRPEAGEVTQLSATVQFANSGGAAWLGWTAVVGIVALGVALLVAVLALVAHQRMRREAAPRRM